jgi:peptidoglycan/xylan/chitin deacetylase (PgdA/CDA1 family)
MIIPALIPRMVTWLFPKRVWRIPTSQKESYLSFDDGPHPRITPIVLDMLAAYDAKAIFFCIGDRVKRYPDIFQRILDEGHAVGNHTFHHLNGWKAKHEDYMSDVEKAANVIDSSLFRPPYGRIKGSQASAIAAKGLKTIMWTVLSGDYDAKLSPGECAERVLRNIAPGFIYLFHDSEKAEKNMFYALGKLLEASKIEGYSCEKLTISYCEMLKKRGPE